MEKQEQDLTGRNANKLDLYRENDCSYNNKPWQIN